MTNHDVDDVAETINSLTRAVHRVAWWKGAITGVFGTLMALGLALAAVKL